MIYSKYFWLIASAIISISAPLFGITDIYNPAQFDQILRENPNVVIDFWMPNCGPCRQLAPKLEAAERQLSPHVTFFKVDVKQVTSLANRFGIRSVPKLIFFKNGGEIGSQMGNTLSEHDLIQKIKAMFGI